MTFTHKLFNTFDQSLSLLKWACQPKMATHSSTLAGKIPWAEKPGRLQSMGSQESEITEWLHSLHFHTLPILQSDSYSLFKVKIQCLLICSQHDSKPFYHFILKFQGVYVFSVQQFPWRLFFLIHVFSNYNGIFNTSLGNNLHNYFGNFNIIITEIISAFTCKKFFSSNTSPPFNCKFLKENFLFRRYKAVIYCW